MYKMILSQLITIIFLLSFQTFGRSTALKNTIRPETSKALAADSLKTKVLVPAYFDPGTSNYWNRLEVQAAKMPNRLYAIANVNNGPGSQYNASYALVINKMHSDSGKVIGYIHTSYGARTLADVEADINSWYSFYPTLDGIFVDEQDNVTGEESYYSEIYNYIKQKDSTALVVTNPGTNTIESYLFYNGKRIADVICIFESNVGYDTWTPASWCNKYSSNNFYVLPYSTSSSQLFKRVDRAESLNVGWIYCTDDGGSNPWDTLPQYFEDFCHYIVTGIDSTNGSNGLIKIDGSFNDWAEVNTLNTSANPLDSTYSSDPNANFTNIWATNDSSKIYLSYQVAGKITTSYFYHIFIDTDGDSSGRSGFVYNDSASVGAEFLVENNSLYQYTGSGGSDWSWSSISGIEKADNGDRTELSIPLNILFPNGLKNFVRIILQTNQATSPFSLMDTAPNDYKLQYYQYNLSYATDVKEVVSKDNYFKLEQNYPNPFNPSTVINYQIPQNGMVSIKIYDVLGKEIETLINQEQQAGKYQITFDATANGFSLPSGIYFYRLQLGNYIKTKKMIILK